MNTILVWLSCCLILVAAWSRWESEVSMLDPVLLLLGAVWCLSVARYFRPAAERRRNIPRWRQREHDPQ